MLKVRDKILLISNVCKSHEFEDGKKLQIQISDDNCKTWRFVCYIDDADSTFFYPHAAVDETNEIVYVAYENEIGACDAFLNCSGVMFVFNLKVLIKNETSL